MRDASDDRRVHGGTCAFRAPHPYDTLRGVATRAQIVPVPAEEFGEKEFYLDEFHSHTLCFAVTLRDCERPGGFESLGRVVRELIANETRVIVLLGVPERGRDLHAELVRVRRRLQRLVLTEETARRFPAVRGRRSASESFVDLSRDRVGEDDLAVSLTVSWLTLRRQPMLVGLVEEARLVDLAQRLAGRLRVHKLVLVEAEGGMYLRGGRAALVHGRGDAHRRAAAGPGGMGWPGGAARHARRRARGPARRRPRGQPLHARGPGAASSTRTRARARCSRCEDYCRIERLGIDDFEEVERLIARGQREGYLKPRTPAEVARVLINGFGAEIGSHHFAGVCGLEIEAYRGERVGEIVGLYTITRFKGEGVGGRLVARALDEARSARAALRLRVHDRRARAGVLRAPGVRGVSPDDVPAGEVDRLRAPAPRATQGDALRPRAATQPDAVGWPRASHARTIGIGHRWHRLGRARSASRRRRQRHRRVQQGRDGAERNRATRCTTCSSSSPPSAWRSCRRRGGRCAAGAQRRDLDGAGAATRGSSRARQAAAGATR